MSIILASACSIRLIESYLYECACIAESRHRLLHHLNPTVCKRRKKRNKNVTSMYILHLCIKLHRNLKTLVSKCFLDTRTFLLLCSHLILLCKLAQNAFVTDPEILKRVRFHCRTQERHGDGIKHCFNSKTGRQRIRQSCSQMQKAARFTGTTQEN